MSKLSIGGVAGSDNGPGNVSKNFLKVVQGFQQEPDIDPLKLAEKLRTKMKQYAHTIDGYMPSYSLDSFISDEFSICLPKVRMLAKQAAQSVKDEKGGAAIEAFIAAFVKLLTGEDAAPPV